MNHNIITDTIEIRTSEDKSKPRYIVRGTAAIADKKHTYQYSKKEDGTYKTLKEMFTPKCIQSIKDQSKTKNVFVDIQHELARNASIKAMVKDKLEPGQQKQLDNMLKRKELPLVKLNDIDIIGNKLDIETELNPMYRDLDQDHQLYFDAVWHNLKEGFLNGISLNFGEFKYATDEHGDTVIDDVDVLGYSLVSGAADPAHSIYEVMIRSLEEGVNIRESEETKMNEKEKELETKEKELETKEKEISEREKKVDAEKADIQKAKEDAEKKVELDKQTEEQKKAQKEMDDKAEALKNSQEENAKLKDELEKSKVAQTPPPNQPKDTAVKGDEFYEAKMKEITKPHDETMKIKNSGKEPLVDNTMGGFSELVNLQAKADDLTADLNDKDAEAVKDMKLLDKTGKDVVTPKAT